MVVNKPTSKQIRGQFDALRATRSHTLSQTIDISEGNFGSGRYFAGATDAYHTDWVGATDTFYIHLDTNDSLVLDNSAGFPITCTKIATLNLVAGQIQTITDERASINGIQDGYSVIYDPSTNIIATGTDVQSAINELDAYITSAIPRLGNNVVKSKDIEISGGILNGYVKVSHANFSQSIVFPKRNGAIPRASYAITIPYDYVQGTDIKVNLCWSPITSDPGDILWGFKYKVLSIDTDEVNSAFTTVFYKQESPGVNFRITGIGNNFIIPSANITTYSNLLIISIERESTLLDTYEHDILLHQIGIQYIGRGIENI